MSDATPAPDRTYDLVLFGATGFTGRLVAEALAGHPDRNRVRWALAGRNKARLEAVRDELAASQPGLGTVDVVLADSHDRPALDALARSTRVVCTTVGPYAKYGADLVAACAAAGTHYCDLTGETHFIRRMIDAHHDEAARTGARIVHCCGFDSIPSDLGTLVLQQAAQANHGAPATRVTYALEKASGGFSGGTVASMLNLLDEAANDRALRRILVDPYSLNPEGERSGPDARDGIPFGWDDRVGAWRAPFVMAAINTRVVRRSHALLGFPWSRDFSYEEITAFPKGVRGALSAAALAGGFAAGFAALATPALRRLIAPRLPAPGEGPSREQMERGRFRVRLTGTGTTPAGQPFTQQALVALDRDPGYLGTAIMLLESALALAMDTDRLPARAGILTPATAMGDVLVERLRRAGMTLDAAN